MYRATHHFFLVFGETNRTRPEGIHVSAYAVLDHGLVQQTLVDGGCSGLDVLLLLASVQLVEVSCREHNTISLELMQ